MFSNKMNSPALQQLQNAVWNKHHRELVTVGGCAVSGWDLRSGKTSFQKLDAHQNALVHLHNVYSVSSAANVEDDDEEERREKPKDGLICSYDQHEDSVYNVTWSPADAWTFASLSYSGRVVISQVPLEEKFKILGV
ncbi:hypothetical protein RO3G_06051 [Rhizopus delemar RA 99-880]|uniref:Uncharacterized protein n=1 Tax=Rhizopus delemar (strain RA 99-880 / ATCC MYA-4621 / FGSC 9543 / NRRL 43880) TaxID=246409 RepID=I1BYR6_RHIO9|nr:hypothetical protein RO3G_06051 [Rhizopus delemar RA 99-880]|eukprot:EIE81346.1 hypothetical protein RO3G_06051 [Rhizopus delemar RA 99-880]